MRSKVTKVVERFIQQGVLDTKTTIEWCIGVLEKHEKFSVDYAQCQLVLDLIKIQRDQKEHLTTIFVQEKDKVSEIKVETPYEKR